MFARLWARAAEGSIDFERKLLAGERIEGDDLAVEIRARHRRRLLGGSILLRQRLGPLEQSVRMHRSRTVVVVLATFRAVATGSSHSTSCSPTRSGLRASSSGSTSRPTF